jgi:ElaB/YqjD/DUF883 family membrane-anchored ribosome-binding protein
MSNRSVGSTLRGAGRDIADRAADMRDSASDALRSAADRLREELNNAQTDEARQRIQQAVDSVEDRLKSIGRETWETIDEVEDDLVAAVRANPWQAVGITFFVGVIIGLIIGGLRD